MVEEHQGFASVISHRYSVVAQYALVLIGMFSLGHVAFGQERTMRVDFGLDTQLTTTIGWNNVSGFLGAEPTVTKNLVDSTGTLTGITLVPSWSATNDDTGIAGTAANYDGPYPAELAGLPQSALRDGLYVRDGETFKLTLSNLLPDRRYDFALYGAAGNTGDYSLFTVTGGTTGQDFIAPLVNNGTKVATISVVPNAMQKIEVLFEGRRPDGSTQNPNVIDDALGRLNYLGITQFALPPGDYSRDGLVTEDDYDVWRENFGSTAILTADGNHNGIVDGADFVIWRHAFAVGSGAGLDSQSPAVPEPHTAALFVMAIISLCRIIARPVRRLA